MKKKEDIPVPRMRIKLKIQEREWRKNRGGRRRDADKVTGKTVVYLDFKGETILDNVANRTSRPHQEVKPRIEAKLKKAGIDTTGMRWNQYAGCSCPCSPGFVLPKDRGKDIWAVITGLKPRTNDAEAYNRAAQIASDPTMPPLSANTL